jgi:hypothetical protein
MDDIQIFTKFHCLLFHIHKPRARGDRDDTLCTLSKAVNSIAVDNSCFLCFLSLLYIQIYRDIDRDRDSKFSIHLGWWKDSYFFHTARDRGQRPTNGLGTTFITYC